MLEEFCALNGVSGDEFSVAEYISDNITADDVKLINMVNGNLIAVKSGKKDAGINLAFYAHMDEVGFIVTSVTKEGFVKFSTVGGIDKRILLSKKVYIGKNKVPGIIGVKAIHLLNKDERKKTIPIREMYIDIGAENKEDALKYVSLGDYIAFSSESFSNGNSFFSKAIDDRAGVSLLLKLLNTECEYGFTVCFDIMEEVGARGALTASELIKPDYAIVVEGTTCSDINDTPEHLRSTVFGGGPALSVRDMGACYNDKLNSFIKDKAEKAGIRYQMKQTHRGGNDSSSIQSAAQGIKTAVVSIPVRYIHSPLSIMNLNDYSDGFRLLKTVADSIGELR